MAQPIAAPPVHTDKSSRRFEKATSNVGNISKDKRAEMFIERYINHAKRMGQKYLIDTNVTLDFVRLANVFSLNNIVADTTIEIRQKNKIKLPDAIIASTITTLFRALFYSNWQDIRI